MPSNSPARCSLVRNRLKFFPAAFLLLLPLLSIPSHAWESWRQPTSEELKMTADPASAGAAAVYFYREEISDDKLHEHTMYERIKILSEKGKQYADVEIPYEGRKFSITNVAGRTIHGDGSIVPFSGKPYDKLYEKTATRRIMAKVFTMPDVQVGSILEYRYDLRYDDDLVSSPFWLIQQDLYVHKAHYSFIPAARYLTITNARGENASMLMWSPILPKGVEVKNIHDHYEVDISEVPAIPHESYMPPIQAFSYRVIFYYTGHRSADEYWKAEGKYWSKSVDHFANRSGTIKAAVDGITAPSDTPSQKLRKIYAEMMKLDNTDFTRKHDAAENRAQGLKSARTAEDIWTQKRGGSDEIAMLFLAMARAAGMKAYAMQVVDRSRSLFNVNYMNFSQLDDTVVIVNLDGKEQFFDPGQRMCSFGQLHWKHTISSGIRQTDNGTQVGQTEGGTSYKETQIRRIADLEVDPHGQVSGQLRINMSGAAALHWRQRALRSDDAEVKKDFEESMRGDVPPGVEIKLHHFIGLDSGEAPLMAVLNVSGTMGTATQKRVLLPSSFFQFGSKPLFVDQKRETPVDLEYPYITSDEISLKLPAGMIVESAPKDLKIPFPQNGLMQVTVKAGTGKLLYTRLFALANILYGPKEYQELRSFYEKVAAKDQEETVLQVATVAGAIPGGAPGLTPGVTSAVAPGVAPGVAP